MRLMVQGLRTDEVCCIRLDIGNTLNVQSENECKVSVNFQRDERKKIRWHSQPFLSKRVVYKIG